MPQTAYETVISFGGKILPQFNAATRGVNLGLLGVQKSVLRLNTQLTGIGAGFAKQMLGLAGIVGVMETVRKSLEIAREEQGVRMALGNLLVNQNALKGIGIQQSRQELVELQRQAEELQKQTGIFSGTFLKGDTLLRQYKLNTSQILAMGQGLGDLLVYQKQLGRSSEELGGVYDALGKAIYGGIGKGLKSVGVELSVEQLRWLKINAQLHNYQANVNMLNQEMVRQHRGAMQQWMSTLPGQSERAMADIRTSLGRMGEVLLPLVQVGQIITARFITPLSAQFEQLAKVVNSQWRSWVQYIDRDLIPAWKRFVSDAWLRLLQAVKWFQENSSWLLPWLKQVSLGIGALTILSPIITMVHRLREAFVLLGLANPWIALATGALLVITNWQRVKQWFEGFREYLLGTKQLDPKNLGFGEGFRKAFPKGFVPRAQKIQLGFETNLEPFLKNELPKFLNEAWDTIKIFWDRFDKWFTPLSEQWFDDTLAWMGTTLANWIKPNLIDPLILQWNSLSTNLIKVWGSTLDNFRDLWNKFLQFIGINQPAPSVNPNLIDPHRPGGKLGPPLPKSGSSIVPYKGINVTHYGYKGDTTPDWNSSHGVGAFPWTSRWWSLQPNYSVALNQMAAQRLGVKPGQEFMYQGRKFRYDDVVPAGYRDKSGRWHQYTDPRMDIYDPYKREKLSSAAGKRGDININYNVGGITIHGANPEEMKRHLASEHSRHLERMRRDLADVIYRNNRQSFA